MKTPPKKDIPLVENANHRGVIDKKRKILYDKHVTTEVLYRSIKGENYGKQRRID